MNPKISVVIPVKNEEKRISACLEGILSQVVPVYEIIVIDSGSSDSTQAIASSYPSVRVIGIQPEQFNHGDTRNLGVELARGEYILFTVGDAWAFDEQWTKNLLAGFTDATVAGVCGLQVVSHDKDTNPLEWYRPVSSNPKMTKYQYNGSKEFDASPPEEKRVSCGWDNVTAMYRRDVLQEIPFKNIVYGEDIYWAIDAYKAGFSLVYNPLARVYHFHQESYETTLKRTISVSYLRYCALGIAPDKMKIGQRYLRVGYRLFREKNLSWKDTLFWIKYNVDLISAIAKGVKYFESARLTEKSDAIELLHKKYCGTPPVPLKSE